MMDVRIGLCSRLVLSCLLASHLTSRPANADSPRETATVQVVKQTQSAVAAVFARKGNSRGSGSGSVIDPRGYVLTAQHVVGDSHVVLLGGRPPLRAEVVGTMKEFDVAVLKLGDQAFNRPASPEYPQASAAPSFIRLAIGEEVMLGESILNIGNPGGRGVVVTQGIVSATNFIAVNALALSTQSSLGFNTMLQFDAASNPGNSGGPLLNMDGEQVGLVTSSIRGEEGIHFAVPMSTIRASLPVMLHSELRHRFVTGIVVDPQLAKVMITEVLADSPAKAAGLQTGDRILSLDGRPLRDPIDWEFSKLEFRPRQTHQLVIQRGEQEPAIDLTLGIRHSHPSHEAKETKPGLMCWASVYDPRVSDPLADEQKPRGTSVVIPTVTAVPSGLPREDHYELLIEGLIRIEVEGLYRMGVSSDDGSRLYVHDRLVADNGGNHAPQVRAGWVDLAAGLHPIRVEFYEDEGQQELTLLIGKGNDELQPVEASQLFHDATTTP